MKKLFISLMILASCGDDPVPAATMKPVVHKMKVGQWVMFESINVYGHNPDFTWPETYEYALTVVSDLEFRCNMPCTCSSNLHKDTNNKFINVNCFYANSGFTYDYGVDDRCQFTLSSDSNGEGSCDLKVYSEGGKELDSGSYNIDVRWLYEL